ncbi:MAG: ankyrin repeat domain-containing protein [Akkermansia sp.]|nr:ankyrin repeat domain-containing protein [Akkermansia sp.]
MKNTFAKAIVLLTVAATSSVADTPYNAPQRVIYRAAVAGATELKQALNSGLNVNAVDDDRETALMQAADKGNLKAVRNLIAAGADVNLQDEDGETALMIAADDGYTEIVRALLSAGADTNLRNEDGETALDISVKERHRETAEVLRSAR